MRKQLGNQSGSMMVQALVTTIVIGVVSGVIFQQAVELNRNLRAPRIKAAQSNVETALRNLLLQPLAYTNCDTNVGSSSCTINPGLAEVATPWRAFANLYETVPFCQTAAPSTHCGVHVVPSAAFPLGFDSGARVFTATIVYDGEEISIKPRDVVITVPVEVLQSSAITCNNPTPLFAGFNADGTKNCKALPAGGACAAGEFVVGFNDATLAPLCQSLDSANHDCGLGAYISTFAWTSGGTLTTTCTPRPPPSVVWPGGVAF